MTDFARLVLASDTTGLRDARSELNHLTRTGAQAESKVDRSMRNMGNSYRMAAAAAAGLVAAAASIGAALRSSQEIQQITNSLRAMGMSTDQASAALESIAGISDRTRAPLSATAKLFQRVSIAGRDLGASQADVLRFTENVGLALGATGISAQEASGALLQLSQAMAGGVVRAEEFNSILEGAFPIAQAAADGIDGAAGSVGRLRAMVVAGEVSSREFFEAIISQSDALQDSFDQTEQTIGQATQGLRDSFALLASETDNAFGISSGIATGLEFVGDNLELIRAGVLGTAAVITGMYLPAIVSAIGATAAWVASLITLRGALMATWIGALIVGAGTLIDFLLRLRSATGSWGEALSALGDLAAGVWEGIKSSAQSIVPALGAVWQSVQASFFILMENLSVRWRDFLKMIAGFAADIPGGGFISDKLLGAAAEANESVTGFMRSANDAEAAAAGLRDKAASLATEGFDKAKEAAARLMEIVNGEADATSAATTEAEKLKQALEEMGDGSGGGAAGKAAKELSSADKALRDFESSSQRASDSLAQAFSSMISGASSASDALKKLLDSLVNILAQDLTGSIFDKLGGGGGGGLLSGLFSGLFGPGQTTGTGLTVDTPNLLPSFAGGGFTGNGSRSGGLDGRGGFLGMLHPRETVLDHTRGQGGGQVNNNITVVAPPGSEVREERRQNSSGGEDLTILIDKAVSGLARDPGSNLSRALNRNFGLKQTTRGR